jgi:hypothetical protein
VPSGDDHSAVPAGVNPLPQPDSCAQYFPREGVSVFFEMERGLSILLGRAVDLNTPDFLSPHLRDRVLAEPKSRLPF